MQWFWFCEKKKVNFFFCRQWCMKPPSTSNIRVFGLRVLHSFALTKTKSLVLWVFKRFYKKKFGQLFLGREIAFFGTFLPRWLFLCQVEKKLLSQQEKEKNVRKQKNTMLIFYTEFKSKQPWAFLKNQNCLVWE